LNDAKTLLIRENPLSEASTESIGQRLLTQSLHDLPLDEPTRAAKRYVEVTADQVRDAFAKWIRPGSFVQVSLGPEPK
jgi:zinc protease